MKKTFERYEDKYLITPSQYLTFLEEIRKYGYLDEYGKYPIESLYLDDEGFKLAKESMASPLTNIKLRLRSYKVSDITEKDTIMLEQKARINGRVNKIRSNLIIYDYLKCLGDIGHISTINQSDQTLQNLIDYQIENKLKPVILVKYEREAYKFDDIPELRVTFDTDIQYCELTNLTDIFKKQNFNQFFNDEIILLEIKYESYIPNWLKNALENSNIELSDFSKYIFAYTDLSSKTSG